MSDDIKDLLLADYRYRAEAMQKNEESGEKRVHLFIALLAAVGSVAGALFSKDVHLGPENGRLFAIAAAIALLIVGWVTLMRMITRNEATDWAKSQLDAIREAFKDRFDDAGALDHYELFRPDRHGNDRIKVRKFGGLAHTVACLNGLLCAGLAFAILFPFDTKSLREILLVPVAAFVVATALQVAYVRSREDRARQDVKAAFSKLTHAGGIVYSVEKDMAERDIVKYLLVTPTQPSADDKLVLPKGHIETEAGESAREAALREVLEESGVVARLIGTVGSLQFSTSKNAGTSNNTEWVRSKFFLMERVSEGPPKDPKHTRHWLEFRDALSATHPESARLLHKAEQLRLRNAVQPLPSG